MKNKLVIGDVTIVRIGNELRFNIPEEMTGKKLAVLKDKYRESIDNFAKTSKD
jgi:hypothetical protein